jgi:ribosomal protein L11 methylase PrmA
MTFRRAAGSHRDPGGFLFWKDKTLYRQINQPGEDAFALLNNSGLYKSLVSQSALIEHEIVSDEFAATDGAKRVIKPQLIETISYPYEWSFSQLKDAALLTLDIQRQAIAHNLSLKDASAYNIQFMNGRPIFIDTLSFDRYEDNKPWVAYGQFCRHFLAPLALMAHVDISLNSLLRTHIDGVPLQLATKLLPATARLKPSLAMHIGLHAKSEANAERNRNLQQPTKSNFSRNAFLGLVDSLTNAVNKLKWKPGGTEWFDYYEANNNYGETGLEEKAGLVAEYISYFKPATVWDLGGNTGRFSRIATAAGSSAVCFDIDPGCVESNYLHCKANNETSLLPLLMDLGSPSPDLGWNGEERMSLMGRGPVELIIALGLVHHLAIGINVPFELIAKMFRQLSPNLIIEFIPRGDSQIDKLLSTRKDVFDEYQENLFIEIFSHYYDIVKSAPIPGTKRTLYAMMARPDV